MQENHKVANATQETKFRVGQTVWCLLYGKGKVSEVAGFVEVDFGWTAELYTFEGVHFGTNESTGGHRNTRTLFFSEPQVIAATEPVFEPKLAGKVVAAEDICNEGFVHVGVVKIETEDSILYEDQFNVYKKHEYRFYIVKDQPITFD